MKIKRIIPCLLLRNNGLVKTVKFRETTYIGDPINTVRIFNEKEVDEIFFLDIDATRSGKEPPYELIQNIASECFMPFAYGGGIHTLQQIERIIKSGAEKAVKQGGASAVAAGSFFVFHGKRRAVLITYPSYSEISDLFN